MKCTFCNSEIKSGTGKMYVENRGTIHRWCSSKCEKNFLMGRVQKKTKWTRSQ